MRVALLTRKWSVRGGNEARAVDLARHLAENGHEVRIVCQKDDKTAELDVAIERLRGISFDITTSMVTWVWSARRVVERMRARGEVDVTIGFVQSVVQDVFRLGGGTHAGYLEAIEEPKPVLDRIALTFERWRHDPKNTPLLVAPSELVRDELEKHYGIGSDRVLLVYNGVDHARFSPEGPGREELRERWGVSEGEKVALFVGHDAWRKGPEVAVEIARRLGVKLVYVGRGRVPAGMIDDGERRDVEKAYRAADVLLHPARYEPFGGVIIEAYASGLPVVGTRQVGGCELARGTELEALVAEDSNDLDGLVRGAELALQRPHLREVACEIARPRTLDRWGKDMTECLLEAARRP